VFDLLQGATWVTGDGSGKDMRRLTVELMEHFRNLLIYQHVGEQMANLDATPEQIRTLGEQAALAEPNRVLQIADQLGEMEGRLRYALSVRTLIEMSLIRCARVARAVSLEDVLRRLNALRTAEPAAAAAAPPAAAPAAAPKPASAGLYDDPALKQVMQMFDGKIVGVEDGSD
jgi:DNA polymerase III gamma/tau subunit